jgi:plastocyanin
MPRPAVPSPRLRAAAVTALLSLSLAACSSSTASPGSSPSAAAAPGSPATQATIVAKNVAFEPQSLTLAAGVPVHLVLQNADNGIPHNLHITGSGQDIVKTDITTGPSTQNLDIGPLQPGGYSFVCDIHTNMTGTIDVPAS